jgi:dienelactone hydrolase
MKFLASFVIFFASVANATCLPEHTDAKIVPMPPGPFYNVTGKFAKFSDCHPSVNLTIVNSKAPVVIVLHGGGGTENYQLAMAKRLNEEGFSTLTYDAFKMNGLYKDAGFWAREMYTPPKQRMLYHTALGAYQWILDNPNILNKSVYIYGTSSGATVALNVASVADPSTLKAVFAEGPAPQGIGFPDVLRVPTYIIYGKEDNYYTLDPSDRFWKKVEKCNWNAPVEDTPKGNADTCNYQSNPQSYTEPALDYFTRQQSKGYKVTITYYEDAGHAFFISDLRREYLPGPKRHITFGSSRATKDKLVKDIVSVIKEK